MEGLILRALRGPPALLLAVLLGACAAPGELSSSAEDRAAAPAPDPARIAKAPLAAPPKAVPEVVPAPQVLPDAAPEPGMPPEAEPTAEAEPEVWHGEASWYGPGLHGRRTASGERFDREALTAAHRSLPFGTVVRVEHMDNGRSVDVRINDRGPFAKRHRNRIIDLSEGAARALGLGRRAGVAQVRITIVPQDQD